MKWFKHETDCDKSEGLNYLIDNFGWEGYGRWFRLLEIIASKMDETDKCSVKYSKKKWSELLGLKQFKLDSLLECFQNKLKTNVKQNDNDIEISIPNLLKKRDNYTRNLQVNSKQEVDVEVDKEIEVENSKSSKIEPTAQLVASQPKNNEEILIYEECVGL